MYDSHSKGISYTAGFFMLIAFAVAGLVLASAISVSVWTAMTGQPFESFTDGMTNPEYANAFKVIQSITAVLSYLLPAVLTAWLLNRRPWNLLGFSGQVKPGETALTIIIILVGLVVSTSLAYFNELIPLSQEMRLKFDEMEDNYNKQVAAIIGLKNNADYIIALLVMAFLPALCEEALFRGGLQNFLTRSTKNYWFSVVVVSLIFSAAHFSYYGFLSRFFLGMVLGLIFQYSGKLWLSILAHFVNNALAITVLYYFIRQGKTMEEAINETNSNWWGVFVLPLLIGLFILFRRIGTPLTSRSRI